VEEDGQTLMLTYNISTGELRDENGLIVGEGYSGKGNCKDDATACELHNLGPIPPGIYSMGEPEDTVTHGPFVIPLTPSPENTMYGRSGFLMHGDSIIAPGTASDGCIIMSRTTRERAAQEGDHLLKVVAGVNPIPVSGSAASGIGGSN
jgi:hypothetical protein